MDIINHLKKKNYDIKFGVYVCVSEFNEFKPRLKSPKNRFQMSAGLNLEKCNTISSKM